MRSHCLLRLFIRPKPFFPTRGNWYSNFCFYITTFSFLPTTPISMSVCCNFSHLTTVSLDTCPLYSNLSCMPYFFSCLISIEMNSSKELPTLCLKSIQTLTPTTQLELFVSRLPETSNIPKSTPSVQFSYVRLFATPWTIARQASLSITNS